MVAYSFKRRFVDPILSGTKIGTIRADRKRHARPGEELQLYVGMRTKSCQLIARGRCVAVNRITLAFRDLREAGIEGAPVIIEEGAHNHNGLDEFARSDGFKDWAELVVFWNKQHGSDVRIFTGIRILWDVASLHGGMKIAA